MQWFKHMSNMKHDVRVKRLITKYGIEGYGVYNAIIESIVSTLDHSKAGPVLKESFRVLSDHFGIKEYKLNRIVWYCTEMGLFKKDRSTGAIYCNKILSYIGHTNTIGKDDYDKDSYVKEKLNTKEFYLDRVTWWIKNDAVLDSFQALKRVYGRHKKEMHMILKTMSYYQFLETGYWRVLSGYIINLNDGRCEICNKKKNMNVHHKTYKHRGIEIFFLDDLQCLCKSCHQEIHNIKGDK